MASAEEKIIVNLHLLKSVLQEDAANQSILEKCEMLEKAMNSRNSYSDKVDILMSVIESVNVWLNTEFFRRTSNEIISLLFEYLLRHTLRLVFHGDWGLSKVVNSHMQCLFTQFRIIVEKREMDRTVKQVDYLLDLMRNDPWENPAIKTLLCGGRETDREVLNFLKQELGVFFSLRLQIMVLSKCEFHALILIEKSLSYISTYSSHFLPNFSIEIRHVRYLHLIVLNRAKSNRLSMGMILKEVNKMGLEECLEFVHQCRKGVLPFEAVLNKAADVVLNMALASAVIKDGSDERLLQELIIVWFDSLTDKNVLSRLLRLLVQRAVCSRYIYAFSKVLFERFKLSDKALCIEVYIRGLSLNANEVERYKLKKEQDKVVEHKVRLSIGFMELADYLENDILLCREFVLTAFSLDPSLGCFEKIKTLAEKTGKLFVEAENKNETFENNPLLNNLACLLPLEENLPNMMGQCAIAPVKSGALGFSLPEHKGSTESKSFSENSSQTCNELLPLLSPKRSLECDKHCPDRSEKSSALNTKVSEQVQLNKQALSENEIADLLTEITNGVLSKEKSYLSMDDEGNIRTLDQENNLGNTNTCFNYGPSQSVQIYNAERVGITQTLCDDLSTLVAYGRNQVFNWDLEWMELKRRCEAYLQNKNAAQACYDDNTDGDGSRDRQSDHASSSTSKGKQTRKRFWDEHD